MGTRQGFRQSPGTTIPAAQSDDDVRQALGLMTKIEIARIRMDGGTQPRAALDKKVIQEYAALMKASDKGDLIPPVKFPPVDVFYDGTDYWLADGFHRVSAAVEADRREIDVTIHQGTRRDAILFSVGVNAEHGLRRTAEDKKRAVMVMLGDPEWNTWGDREIARQCKVSHGYVGKLRTTCDTLDSESSVSQGRKYTDPSGRKTIMQTERIQRSNQSRKSHPGERYVRDDYSQDSPDDEPYTDPVQAELSRLREQRRADPPPPATPRGGIVIQGPAQPVGPALALATALKTALDDAVKSLDRIATLHADPRLAALPSARKTVLRDEVARLGEVLPSAHDHLAAIYELLNEKQEGGEG